MSARKILVFCVFTVVTVAVMLVAACGSYSAPTPTPGGGGGGGTADVIITIAGMNDSQSFSPNPATVRVGQTVAWRNADNTTHTATANGGAFNTGAIAPGATSGAVIVSAAGSYDYFCQIHPTMVGTLTVTP